MSLARRLPVASKYCKENYRMSNSKIVGAVEGSEREYSPTLEDLVRDHHRELRAYLVRRVSDLAVADDIAQDVFLAALQQFEKAGDGHVCQWRAWLFQVARHKAVDHIRRISRESNNLEEIEFLLAKKAIDRIEREGNFVQRQQDLEMQALHACVNALNDKSKELVETIYFKNVSAEKFAAGSNRKGSSVRMALLRIRKALAVCVRQRLQTQNELNDGIAK